MYIDLGKKSLEDLIRANCTVNLWIAFFEWDRLKWGELIFAWHIADAEAIAQIKARKIGKDCRSRVIGNGPVEFDLTQMPTMRGLSRP